MIPFMPKRMLAQFDAFAFEQEALAMRVKLMQACSVEDARIEVAVAAVADMVAIAAVKLDTEGDTHTLQDRLHSFCQRVEETYKRMRDVRHLHADAGQHQH